MPSNSIPSLRSEISFTPSLNVAYLNSARGSLPGFSSSAIVSRKVGSPTVSVTYFFRFTDLSLSPTEVIFSKGTFKSAAIALTIA